MTVKRKHEMAQKVIVSALNAVKKHRTRMVFLARMKGVLAVEPNCLERAHITINYFNKSKKKNKKRIVKRKSGQNTDAAFLCKQK